MAFICWILNAKGEHQPKHTTIKHQAKKDGAMYNSKWQPLLVFICVKCQPYGGCLLLLLDVALYFLFRNHKWWSISVNREPQKLNTEHFTQKPHTLLLYIPFFFQFNEMIYETKATTKLSMKRIHALVGWLIWLAFTLEICGFWFLWYTAIFKFIFRQRIVQVHGIMGNG